MSVTSIAQYASAAVGSTSAGTNWTTTANAVGGSIGTTSASWAVWANSTASAVGTLELSGYNGQTMLGGVQPQSIDSVTATITHNVTNTSRITNATAQLFSGSTPIGTGWASLLPLSTSTSAQQTVTFPGAPPTWAQLPDLRVRIVYTRGGVTQAASANVDAVAVAINYTPAPLPAPVFGTPTVTDTTVSIPYSAVSGAATYDWERGGAVIATGQPGLTLSDVGLTAGTAYTYRVRAVDAGSAAGVWSDPLVVTTSGAGAVTQNVSLSSTSSLSATVSSSLTRSTTLSSASSLGVAVSSAQTQNVTLSSASSLTATVSSTQTRSVTLSSASSLSGAISSAIAQSAILSSAGSLSATVSPSVTQAVSLSSASTLTGYVVPKIATLVDSFDALAPGLWTYPAGSTVTGGQLQIATSDQWPELHSKIVYDLTGSSYVVEVSGHPNGAGYSDAYMGVFDLALNNSISMDIETSLTVYVNVGGTYTAIGGTAYSATTHRWMRIRESGGTVFFDTSPDGTTWTNLTTWVPTFSITSLTAVVGTGADAGVTGTATFEGVNFVPAAPVNVTLTSSSTLTATVSSSVTQSVSLSSAGSLTATVTPSKTVSATLSSAGSLTATVTPSKTVSTTLSSASSLTATVTPSKTVSATLSGASSLTATVTPSKTVSANLSSAGSLMATTALALTVAANMQAASQLIAVLGSLIPPSHIYGTATLFKPLGTAVLVGDGKSTSVLAPPDLVTATLVPMEGLATLAGNGTATATLIQVAPGTAILEPATVQAVLHTTD